MYLERNGNRPIGDEQTVDINLAEDVSRNPVLVGQMSGALNGQPLLSINGSPFMVVGIDDYPVNDCVSGQWRDWVSFRLKLDPELLRKGNNVLRWRVGSRPACANNNSWWDGFQLSLSIFKWPVLKVRPRWQTLLMILLQHHRLFNQQSKGILRMPTHYRIYPGWYQLLICYSIVKKINDQINKRLFKAVWI